MKKTYILKLLGDYGMDRVRRSYYVAGTFATANIQAATRFNNRKAADKAKREWISAMDWPKDTPLIEVAPVWDSHGLVM